MVLWQNLADGGVHLDRQTAREQVASERTGPLSIGRRDIAVFVVILFVLVLAAVWVRSQS